MLRDAGDFKRAMLEAKHELELELSGARPMPAPPLRDRAAGSAVRARGPVAPAGRRRAGPPRRPPPPAPAPAAAASSAPSQMSADDVTRTLASLADLRDRGAISAEEYEAKKADLLRRL